MYVGLFIDESLGPKFIQFMQITNKIKMHKTGGFRHNISRPRTTLKY